MIPIAILTLENDDDRSFIIRLYADYRWLMYKIALEIIQDAQAAEDIVSQAMCEMIDVLDDLRKINSCKLKTYIAILVRNDSIDYVRKQNRRSKYLFSPKDDGAITDEEIDAALIREAEIAELKKGLARMTEGERMLLTMKYLDEASDEEIAKRFGIKPASVRTYLSRARNKLCQLMKEED